MTDSQVKARAEAEFKADTAYGTYKILLVLAPAEAEKIRDHFMETRTALYIETRRSANRRSAARCKSQSFFDRLENEW